MYALNITFCLTSWLYFPLEMSYTFATRKWLGEGFGFIFDLTECLQLINTNDYNSLANLHTL
jgi:hypothetical protein